MSLKRFNISALINKSDIDLALTAIAGGMDEESALETVYKSAEGKTFYAASNFSGTNKYLNVGESTATGTSTSLTADAILTVEYAGDGKYYIKGNNGKYICAPSSTDNEAPSTTSDKASAGKYYIGNLYTSTDNLVFFTTKKTAVGSEHEALHFINHTNGVTCWGFRPDASQWQIEPISLGDYDDDDDITINYTLTDQNSNSFTGSVAKKFSDLYGLVSTFYNPTCITWSDNGEGTFTYSAKVTTPFIAGDNYAGITHWYNVRMHSNQTHYMYYDSEASVKVAFSDAIGENTNAYLWGYVGNPIAGYQIYNKEAGSSIAVTNENPCSMSADGTSAHFYVTNSAAGSQGASADAYFAMYATSGSYLNWNWSSTHIERYSDNDAGSTFMIYAPTVSYSLTDLNGATYEGTYKTNLIGSEEPPITGCYGYTLSNKAWSGTNFTANVAFPFFVSSNGKNVYTYMAGYENHCWKAVGVNIKDFGVVSSTADAAYDWQIIPSIASNVFSFKIKNRSTGTYIYSTATSTSHDEGTVTLNSTGTDFAYTANGWCFPQTKADGAALYISENSSSSTDQFVGIWTSHNGTAARFYLPKVTSGFYRLKGKTSGKYLASGSASNGKYAMTNAIDASTIFYYDGTILTNLGSGMCNGMDKSSWDWVLGANAKTVTFQDGLNNRGYGILSNNNANFYDNGDNSNSADLGGELTIKASTNARYCSWQVEEVISLPIAISSVGYSTLYSPVALTIPDGLTAYIASDEGEYLHLTAIEGGKIPANTGVILAGTASTTYNFDITTGGSVDGNALTGTSVAINRPDGSYVLATGTVDEEKVVGFFAKGDTGATTIPGFKAYLAAGGGAVKTFRFDFDDETGINEVNGEGINVVNGPIYNLAGQRLNKMQKGINIVNGKKVLK